MATRARISPRPFAINHPNERKKHFPDRPYRRDSGSNAESAEAQRTQSVSVIRAPAIRVLRDLCASAFSAPFPEDERLGNNSHTEGEGKQAGIHLPVEAGRYALRAYVFTLTLNELHAAVSKALAQASETAPLRGLALEAQRMADMTGWAMGPIDPQGHVAAAFGLLKVQARARYEETQDAGVAQLHDALGDLLHAIASHDDDLKPDGTGASADDN